MLDEPRQYIPHLSKNYIEEENMRRIMAIEEEIRDLYEDYQLLDQSICGATEDPVIKQMRQELVEYRKKQKLGIKVARFLAGRPVIAGDHLQKSTFDEIDRKKVEKGMAEIIGKLRNLLASRKSLLENLSAETQDLLTAKNDIDQITTAISVQVEEHAEPSEVNQELKNRIRAASFSSNQGAVLAATTGHPEIEVVNALRQLLTEPKVSLRRLSEDFKQFHITNPQYRLELAELLITQDVSEVADNFDQFEIVNPADRLRLLWVILAKYPQEVAKNFARFEILNEDVRTEIFLTLQKKIVAEHQSGSNRVSLDDRIHFMRTIIGQMGFSQQHLVQIAKSIDPLVLLRAIHGFAHGVDEKTRISFFERLLGDDHIEKCELVDHLGEFLIQDQTYLSGLFARLLKYTMEGHNYLIFGLVNQFISLHMTDQQIRKNLVDNCLLLWDNSMYARRCQSSLFMLLPSDPAQKIEFFQQLDQKGKPNQESLKLFFRYLESVQFSARELPQEGALHLLKYMIETFGHDSVKEMMRITYFSTKHPYYTSFGTMLDSYGDKKEQHSRMPPQLGMTGMP